MDRKYKYRIKTREEFLLEFGDNWRSVRAAFVDDMDYLLGKDIDREDYLHVLNSDGNIIVGARFNILKGISSGTWEISDQMVIKEYLEPLAEEMYKPKKFIY